MVLIFVRYDMSVLFLYIVFNIFDLWTFVIFDEPFILIFYIVAVFESKRF